MTIHGSLFTDFKEKDTQDPFSLQNKKMLRIDMRYGEVWARTGSMVAYQGDVRFVNKGSGGISKMLKAATTGEGVKMMQCSGSGELFVADDASEIYAGAVEVSTDRDEILVIGTIAEPDLAADASSEARAAAIASRIAGFREDTRGKRMQIADEAQHRFAKAVSWGARCADQQVLVTTLSVPAMTRLRMPERKVLDTLVEAGVARSRSHALAWCVRLVAERQDDWLRDLQEALTKVEEVRAEGPRD